MMQSALETIQKLKSRYFKVVSLHVRRGNIAHAHEILGRNDFGHGIPVTMDYINSAIAEFEPETCFFVFSDMPKDITWCRENIKAKNLEFSKASRIFGILQQ